MGEMQVSAIFGIINLDGGPVERDNPALMDNALAHHGSEGGGLWLSGAAALGQRLRRFTPQDDFEHQPLISTDGLLALVSDARIDNRIDLLAAINNRFPLENADATAQMPDSDLILRAYQKWGRDCVSRLVGVFAFALWDKRTKSLFAARSPIMAPTFMYAKTGRIFSFATTPAGLHALPWISRLLNEERLADMMVQMPGGEREATLYRNIFRLPTGFCLTADENGVKTRCYWQPDLNREIRLARDEDYSEAFLDLFVRIAGDYLRSSTPVAIQMSGGLDSASIAAVSASLLAIRNERLTAYTEVPCVDFSGTLPAGRYANETQYVRDIAAMHENIDLNLIHTDGRFFLDDLDRLFPHLEAPFRNTSNRVWIEAIIGETSRRGMKVLLDGLSGNLTISWNGGGLLPGLIREGKWSQALSQARALVTKGNGRSTTRCLIGQGLLPLLPDVLWKALEQVRHSEARTTTSWLTYYPISPGFAADQRIPQRAGERNYMLRFRPKADSRVLRHDVLANHDSGAYICAYRSLFGVDMRAPAADVRLAEFCLALPENQYLRDGEPRSLIRRAMSSYLPRTVLSNRLRGLQAADWFERLHGAQNRVSNELNKLEQSDLARRILDLKRMRRLFDRMPRNGNNSEDIFTNYRLILQQGLMIGRFLRWFESGE